ncbi:hypothetical protein [Undibacterium sp. CCC3.4]|uniref:hypothetical protein n=1 Tax=Undibacterium sp. CCC3.4 TaxID=3048609 RepID=UPI002AC8F2EE|nr:hypothetical protein [Undibacterium sp. CCC3.4]WPX45320.1 hypothetical protein RHM61_08935 [Undibacterium sp. CCC3.4]
MNTINRGAYYYSFSSAFKEAFPHSLQNQNFPTRFLANFSTKLTEEELYLTDFNTFRVILLTTPASVGMTFHPQ